jgi:transcription elongation factor Elf1
MPKDKSLHGIGGKMWENPDSVIDPSIPESSLESKIEAYECPQCGKKSLTLVRKPNERTVIVFCSTCRLDSSFEVSDEELKNEQKWYDKFVASY